MDSYTGELLDTVEKLGVKDNTIFIFTSDNGPEMIEPWNGWAGKGAPFCRSAFTWSERFGFLVLLDQLSACTRYSTSLAGRSHSLPIWLR